MPDHVARFASGILDRRTTTTGSVGLVSSPILSLKALGLGFVEITNNDATLSIDCDVQDSGDNSTFVTLPDSTLKLAAISPGETRRYELPRARRAYIQVRGTSNDPSSVSVTAEVWSAVGA